MQKSVEAAERRSEILKILCRRRHETIRNLALEFGVSERTIRRDIEALSLSKPIDTCTGRYGGVYLSDRYSMDRMYMNAKELAVLQKLSCIAKKANSMLTEKEIKILDSIIIDFSEKTL